MHSAAKPKTHPSKKNVHIFFPLTSSVIANRAKMRNLSSANTEAYRANDPKVFADYLSKSQQIESNEMKTVALSKSFCLHLA